MVGKGCYASQLVSYINIITDWKVVAYTDEFVQTRGEHGGKPVVPMDDIVSTFPPNEFEVVIGVGYLDRNRNRKRIYEKIKQMGYKMPNLIHERAILNNAILGDANIILENVVFGPNTKIGSNNRFSYFTSVGHDCTLADHIYCTSGVNIAGSVTIGECCFLGLNSTVKNGVSIAPYTLVGATTYVSENTDAYDIIVPSKNIILKGKKNFYFK